MLLAQKSSHRSKRDGIPPGKSSSALSNIDEVNFSIRFFWDGPLEAIT